MAVVRLPHTGYGQIELNNVAWRRDGRIEAQCALSDDFAEVGYAENGMLLAVDNVNRLIKLPTDNLPLAIVYSSEHMYDERANGLKDFANKVGSFYPRLGYPAVGDKFTTNCVSYETDDFADFAAIKTAIASGSVYGGKSTDGSILLDNTKPSAGPVFLAVAATTMPDGQAAIKFQVLSV